MATAIRTGSCRSMTTGSKSSSGADRARASRPSRSRLFSAWAASRFSFCFRSSTSWAVTSPRCRLSSAHSFMGGRYPRGITRSPNRSRMAWARAG